MEKSFMQWMKDCDKYLSRFIPLSIHDLPDASWRDYYEDGMSPEDAVQCANEDYWDGQMSLATEGQWWS